MSQQPPNQQPEQSQQSNQQPRRGMQQDRPIQQGTQTGPSQGSMGLQNVAQRPMSQEMPAQQTTRPVQSAAMKSEQQLRREYPAFWQPGTQQEPTNIPTPQELERMEQIQQQRGPYPTESQTPAYREAQSEIVEERMGDQTTQGAQQPSYGQLYQERQQMSPAEWQRHQQGMNQ